MDYQGKTDSELIECWLRYKDARALALVVSHESGDGQVAKI